VCLDEKIYSMFTNRNPFLRNEFIVIIILSKDVYFIFCKFGTCEKRDISCHHLEHLMV